MRSKIFLSLLVLLLFGVSLPGSALAQDIPLNNWTVPPYQASDSGSGGFTTMTDVTAPRAFIGIQPCRVADTRGNGAPIQGGIFANSEARTWDVTNVCGIPAGADAISVNFTVVSTAATPTGAFLLAWPTGQAPPPTAIMAYGPGVTVISNAAIVPLGPSEQLNVNVSHSTHIIMDVNGYFSDMLANPGDYLALTNDNPGFATAFFHNAASANNSSGVYGFAGPSFLRPSYKAAGVRGDGITHGVLGISQQAGVAGSLVRDSDGVELTFGILGYRSDRVYGVYGQTYSTASGAGVFGVDGSGLPGNLSILFPAGVRGASLEFTGVDGRSRQYGVSGHLHDAAGNVSAIGLLGAQIVGAYGVYSSGNAHVAGTVTATTKAFVQPHPHDPGKEIRYVSLEGPQSEVYFRGAAQVSQGITRVDVPEHFRFVADPRTYSTLVTPVGAMASVAVLSQGPEGIVVQASRDVRVQYVVYAEREAIKNPDPIIENVHFRPDPDIDVLAQVPDTYRQLMIQNGTLKPDGTVNMETARRLGWDKEWEERARPASRVEEP